MENKILTILGIVFIFAFFQPFWRNARRSEIKDFIDGRQNKFSKWSFKKFLRKLRYTSKNTDFFLGENVADEKKRRIRNAFYQYLVEVSGDYIQSTGKVHDLNNRIDFVFEELEKLSKDKDVRELLFLSKTGHVELMEDILLESKNFFTDLVESYINSLNVEKIRILLYHFGFLSCVERLGLNKIRLHYILVLKESAEELINNQKVLVKKREL